MLKIFDSLTLLTTTGLRDVCLRVKDLIMLFRILLYFYADKHSELTAVYDKDESIALF